jgi:TRAP-type C4-dicarboxylate transport system permease small subunit
MSEDRKGAQGRKPLQRLAEGLMVLALAGMVIAVFVNVVLRYVFTPASSPTRNLAPAVCVAGGHRRHRGGF